MKHPKRPPQEDVGDIIAKQIQDVCRREGLAAPLVTAKRPEIASLSAAMRDVFSGDKEINDDLKKRIMKDLGKFVYPNCSSDQLGILPTSSNNVPTVARLLINQSFRFGTSVMNRLRSNVKSERVPGGRKNSGLPTKAIYYTRDDGTILNEDEILDLREKARLEPIREKWREERLSKERIVKEKEEERKRQEYLILEEACGIYREKETGEKLPSFYNPSEEDVAKKRAKTKESAQKKRDLSISGSRKENLELSKSKGKAGVGLYAKTWLNGFSTHRVYPERIESTLKRQNTTSFAVSENPNSSAVVETQTNGFVIEGSDPKPLEIAGPKFVDARFLPKPHAGELRLGDPRAPIPKDGHKMIREVEEILEQPVMGVLQKPPVQEVVVKKKKRRGIPRAGDN